MFGVLGNEEMKCDMLISKSLTEVQMCVQKHLCRVRAGQSEE